MLKTFKQQRSTILFYHSMPAKVHKTTLTEPSKALTRHRFHLSVYIHAYIYRLNEYPI